MRAETFYVAVAEGESPLDGMDAVLEDTIEDAETNGEDIVTNSCAGSPQAQIYEVTVRLVKESVLSVTWENV